MEPGNEAADRPRPLAGFPGIHVIVLCVSTAVAACGSELTPPARVHGPVSLPVGGAGPLELSFEPTTDAPVLITVSARDVDVRATLLTNGAAALYCDAPNRRMGVEMLLVEGPRASAITLRIERNDHSAARGEAVVEALALPLANAADRARLEAARQEAAACLAFPDLAAKDQAAAAYEAAARSWRDAGDRRREGFALLHAAGVRYLRHADWQAAASLAASASGRLERSDSPAQAAFALRLEGAALDQLANAANFDLRRREATVRRAQDRLSRAARRFDGLGMPYEAGYAMSYRAVSRGMAGDVPGAHADFESALARFRKAGDGPAQAVALQSIAHQSFEDGRIHDAVREFEDALALIPRDEEPASYAHTLHNSALPLRILGRFDEAMEREHESARILRQLGDRDGEARALHALGLILMSTGEIERAAEPMRAASRLRGETGVRREQGITLINLAEIERAMGRHDAAHELSRQALDMLIAPHDRARGLMSLARDHLAAGDDRLARQRLEAILALALPDTHRMRVMAVVELALLELRAGRVDRGETHFRRALAVQESSGADVDLAQTLQRRAASRLGRGDAAGALDDATAALARFETIGLNALHAEARAAFRAAYRDAVELRIAALLERSSSLHEADDAEALRLRRAAFETSDRARAQLLADTAPVSASFAPRELLQERQHVYEQLAAKRQRHDRLLESADPGLERAQVLAREMELLRARARLLDGRIARATAGPAAGGRGGPLAEGDQVAEFYIGRHRAWLFVVSGDDVEVHPLPSPAELDAGARELHRSWRRAAPGAADRLAAARQLARRIFGPLGDIPPRGRLLIVPDGALHLVPMALLAAQALPGLDAGAAVVIPSVATLRESGTAEAPPAATLAIIADPVYETGDPRVAALAPPALEHAGGSARATGERAGLRRLPAAGVEARELAALVGDPDRLLALVGPDASRSNVMQADLERYRFVHFAAHAFADARDPALAWLALSNVDVRGATVDGSLRLYDITQLRLDADLVVLSGCDTALGREIAGEGPIGLSHAFLRSGARAVIATLWSVPDTSTAVLMREFYREMLQGGHAAPHALARAQARLRQQPRWSDPYYWAGFQLVSSGAAHQFNNNVTGREES
ncbi:MAG TPA: CHAT domain-containing protein [Steroidobacteraceae bacterium]|nr:CHAT domain-containing protein [Steroidobacteraceae bacterium]